VEQRHLKSILNLRGSNPGEVWFDEEMRVSNAHHLTHLDIALSAGTVVSPEQIQSILQMIDQAPKPLLVHCTDGADRTGLVLGLYLEQRGIDAQSAHEQLSWRYGHFPHLRWSFTKAMDESFESYERFLLQDTKGRPALTQ
jgi:protein tyrosine/serine phosphatase